MSAKVIDKNTVSFFDQQEKKLGIKKEKYKKKAIPQELRAEVWNKYIGNQTSGTCLCCNKNTIVSFSSKKQGFEAGHIIAESLGGPTTLENLRPICKKCNGQMRTKNMIEFQKEKYPEAKPINSGFIIFEDIYNLYDLSKYTTTNLKTISFQENPINYDTKDITNPITLYCGPVEDFVQFVSKTPKKDTEQFKDLIDFHNKLNKN